MDITRQYLRQLNESFQKNESREKYYIIPGAPGNYIGAIDEENYNAREEKYQKRCVPIEISDEVGTQFNAIVLEIVPDAFDEEQYYYEQNFGVLDEDFMPNIAIIPLSKLGKEWDEQEIGDYVDITKKEFLAKVKSSTSLTQEQIDLFKEIYDDYQNLGYFTGVTVLPKRLPKIPGTSKATGKTTNKNTAVENSIKKDLESSIEETFPKGQKYLVQVSKDGYHIEATVWKGPAMPYCYAELDADASKDLLKIGLDWWGDRKTEPLNGRTPEDLKNLCMDLLKEQLMQYNKGLSKWNNID